MLEAKRRRVAGAHPRSVRDADWKLLGFALAGCISFVLFLGLIVMMIFIGLGLFRPTPARAHSFYPWECCHDQDCWPMGPDADAREPEPRVAPGGYLTFDGIFIPQSAARPSPDGRFHICRRGGARDGVLIEPSTGRPCLWAPVPGT